MSHLKEINYDILNQNQIEKLLLCLLFVGIYYLLESELK